MQNKEKEKKKAEREQKDQNLKKWQYFDRLVRSSLLENLYKMKLKQYGIKDKPLDPLMKARAVAIIFAAKFPDTAKYFETMDANVVKDMFEKDDFLITMKNVDIGKPPNLIKVFGYIKMAVENNLQCPLNEDSQIPSGWIEIVHFHLDQGFFGRHTYFEALKSKDVSTVEVVEAKDDEFWNHIKHRTTSLERWFSNIVDIVDTLLHFVDIRAWEWVQNNFLMSEFKDLEQYWRDKISMFFRFKYLIMPIKEKLYPQSNNFYARLQDLKLFAYNLKTMSYVYILKEIWQQQYHMRVNAGLYEQCYQVHQALHGAILPRLLQTTEEEISSQQKTAISLISLDKTKKIGQTDVDTFTKNILIYVRDDES